MKLLAIALNLAVLLGPASAQPKQGITIARSGSQAASQGQAEYFTGSVRVDPLFSVAEPSRSRLERVSRLSPALGLPGTRTRSGRPSS